MKKIVFVLMSVMTMMMSVCFASPSQEAVEIPSDFLTAPAKYTISLGVTKPVDKITFNGVTISVDELFSPIISDKTFTLIK